MNPLNLLTKKYNTKIVSQMPRLGIDASKIKKVSVPKMNRPWRDLRVKKFSKNSELSGQIGMRLNEIELDDNSGFELTFSDYNYKSEK